MRGLPILAVILGILGLLPFLGCTIGIIAFPRHIPVPNLVQAIIAYGAVILAFLGGVHWGFALEAAPAIMAPSLAATNSRRLALGVVPSLVGWGCIACATRGFAIDRHRAADHGLSRDQR